MNLGNNPKMGYDKDDVLLFFILFFVLFFIIIFIFGLILLGNPL
jgi:hypothetical protein